MGKTIIPQIGMGSVVLYSTDQTYYYEIENFCLPEAALSIIVLEDSAAREVLFNYLVSYQGRRNSQWCVISRCKKDLKSSDAVIVSQNPEAQFSECFNNLQFEFTLGLAVRSRSARHQEVSGTFYLSVLGLQDKVEENVAELSSGQKQRLLLASALAITDNLLLIDSGLGFIDSETRERLFPFLRQICRALDISIVIGVTSTANIDLAHFDSVLYAKCIEQVPVNSDQLVKEARPLGDDSVDVVKGVSSEIIIDCNHLSLCFPESGLTLYNGLSFKLYSHQALALIGPNGSGKSTLAKILSGFWEPSAGSVQVCSQNSKFWFLRKTPMISIAFPDPDLTITQPSVAADLNQIERGLLSEAGFQEILSKLCLDQNAHMNPFDLDWKMRRRLGLAKAIRAAKAAVFCDEPWLDEADIERGVLREIVELCVQQGLSIIVATNDNDFAMTVGLHGIIELPSSSTSAAHKSSSSIIQRLTRRLTNKRGEESFNVNRKGNVNHEFIASGWMSHTAEFSLFWERNIYPFLPSLISKLNLPPDIMLLDIGCGTGMNLACLYNLLNKNGIRASDALGIDNDIALISVGKEIFSKGGKIEYICEDLTDNIAVEDIIRNYLTYKSNLLVTSLFSLHDLSSWHAIRNLLNAAHKIGGSALAVFVSPSWVESRMNLPKILHKRNVNIQNDWEWMAPFPVTKKNEFNVPYYHRTIEQYIDLYSSFWNNIYLSSIDDVFTHRIGSEQSIRLPSCRSDKVDFLIAMD